MKLTKTTYLKSDADKVIDRSFNEFSKKRQSITVSGFFKMYKDIFFRIPKKGVNSHTTLYNDSGRHIENPQRNTEVQIQKLQKKISELQKKISELERNNEMLKSTNASQSEEINQLKA